MFKAAAQNAPTTWTEGPQFTQVYGYVQDGLGQMADKEITLSQMLTQIQSKTVDPLTQQGLQVTTD